MIAFANATQLIATMQPKCLIKAFARADALIRVHVLASKSEIQAHVFANAQQ